MNSTTTDYNLNTTLLTTDVFKLTNQVTEVCYHIHNKSINPFLKNLKNETKLIEDIVYIEFSDKSYTKPNFSIYLSSDGLKVIQKENNKITINNYKLEDLKEIKLEKKDCTYIYTNN